jgi:hypothetical protein
VNKLEQLISSSPHSRRYRMALVKMASFQTWIGEKTGNWLGKAHDEVG